MTAPEPRVMPRDVLPSRVYGPALADARHAPNPTEGDVDCLECGQPWPCPGVLVEVGQVCCDDPTPSLHAGQVYCMACDTTLVPDRAAPEPRVMPRDVLREMPPLDERYDARYRAGYERFRSDLETRLAAVPSESDAGLDAKRLAAAIADHHDICSRMAIPECASRIIAEYDRLARP